MRSLSISLSWFAFLQCAHSLRVDKQALDISEEAFEEMQGYKIQGGIQDKYYDIEELIQKYNEKKIIAGEDFDGEEEEFFGEKRDIEEFGELKDKIDKKLGEAKVLLEAEKKGYKYAKAKVGRVIFGAANKKKKDILKKNIERIERQDDANDATRAEIKEAKGIRAIRAEIIQKATIEATQAEIRAAARAAAAAEITDILAKRAAIMEELPMTA